MNYVFEPDPTEAAHDGRCPICDSTNIQFERDLGKYPVDVMYEGKRCQQVIRRLWQCKNCFRLFISNKFFTQ